MNAREAAGYAINQRVRRTAQHTGDAGIRPDAGALGTVAEGAPNPLFIAVVWDESFPSLPNTTHWYYEPGEIEPA